MNYCLGTSQTLCLCRHRKPVRRSFMLNGHKMGLLRAFAAVDNLAEKYLGNLGKYTQRHKMWYSHNTKLPHTFNYYIGTHIF